MTINATGHSWGSTSFNSTTDIKVGKTGSTSTDGTKYKGYISFPALDKTIVIKSIKLVVYRIDTYAAHTLSFGSSSSNSWSATLNWSKNYSITSGANAKTLDISEFTSILQGYAGAWHIHIQHGSGTNSYSEFNWATSANRPRLVIEYECATVWYRNGSTWVRCLVYYRNGSSWVQCIPYYRNGSTWVQV